jgi:hypothetical protein
MNPSPRLDKAKVAARRRKRESRGGRLRWEPLVAAAGASGSSTTSHASPLVQRIGRTHRQWKRRPRDTSLGRRSRFRIHGTAVRRCRKKELNGRSSASDIEVSAATYSQRLSNRKEQPTRTAQEITATCRQTTSPPPPSRRNITSSGTTQGAHHLTGALGKPPPASLNDSGCQKQVFRRARSPGAPTRGLTFQADLSADPSGWLNLSG